jgi:hypothetical protein
MKALAWYIDLNDTENKNILKISRPYWYQKRWIPHYRYEWYKKKIGYQINTGIRPNISFSRLEATNV